MTVEEFQADVESRSRDLDPVYVDAVKRLSGLSPEARAAFAEGRLSRTEAYAICRCPSAWLAELLERAGSGPVRDGLRSALGGPMKRGDRVVTRLSSYTGDWNTSSPLYRARRDNCRGTVVAEHGAHGEYYDVRHDGDDTVGCYDPHELVPIPASGGIQVCGRYPDCPTKSRPKFTASLATEEGSQVVRVDDEDHPDFWLEVRIPTGVGAKIIRSVVSQRYEVVAEFVGATREEWEAFRKQLGVE